MPRQLPPITADVAVRFWAKVNKTDSCWLWTGATNSKGYGMLGIKQSQYLATRVSWFLQHGEDPGDELVLHDCPGGDCPGCVNPAHLYLGQQDRNVQDTYDKSQRQSTLGMRYNRSISPAQEEQIRAEYKARRVTLEDLATRYNTSKSTISRIINGFFSDGPTPKVRRITLTSEQIQEIKNLFLMPVKHLATRYRVSESTILRVRQGYYD